MENMFMFYHHNKGKIKKLSEVSRDVGLEINVESFEKVVEGCYLGRTVTNQNDSHDETE
jgi:hypothetical protein